MVEVKSITTEGNITTVLLDTNKASVANLVKRAILAHVPTYTIDLVIFDVNTSVRYDEVLALRLGQLVIDHTRYTGGDGFKTQLSVKGPKEVTSDDIPGIPFAFPTPLVTLLEGQEIRCELVVKEGLAKTHVKWRPVSTVTLSKEGDLFKLTVKSIGMMPGEEIVKVALTKLEEAANERPINLFFRILNEE